MTSTPDRTALGRAFLVTLILKGVDGALELVAGVALLLVSPAQLEAVARSLTRHELREDPHDPIANALVHYATTLNVSATTFGAIYLLAHGIVKVVLVFAVLRDKLWAYPWLIGFLVVFIGYQVYELFVHASWGLAALTAFDIVMVLLTVQEYRVQRGRRSETAAGQRPTHQEL